MPVDAQWFGVIVPDVESSFRVLVIGGRVASCISYAPLGAPWKEHRAKWERWGWKVAPLPEVPAGG